MEHDKALVFCSPSHLLREEPFSREATRNEQDQRELLPPLLRPSFPPISLRCYPLPLFPTSIPPSSSCPRHVHSRMLVTQHTSPEGRYRRSDLLRFSLSDGTPLPSLLHHQKLTDRTAAENLVVSRSHRHSQLRLNIVKLDSPPLVLPLRLEPQRDAPLDDIGAGEDSSSGVWKRGGDEFGRRGEHALLKKMAESGG
ncbi:hypothetical protein BDY24DRAFT_401058 [Mrakia frigida]|uniref:uncharacterized protein n=1 Tax=Mrakia frigida TaxID=29902 RepID=UPI003FCC016F